MKNQITNSKTENKPKETTKERIFSASLDLFSQKGFDAVSVREIAREVGIRESSIYNHYKGKEAILDAILDYFMSGLNLDSPSEEALDQLIDQGPDIYFEVGARMFIERVNTPTMEKIWRLVSIELYHNEKIRNFFKKELIEEPINSWESIFTKMIEKGFIKPFNPRTLAYEYFSFALYLFFEYFVLKYDEDYDSFMDLALAKMDRHAGFLLDTIKV